MEKRIRKITLIGMNIDEVDDNVDVEVELSNHEKYVATFFTLENIKRLMDNDTDKTGECNNGSFFWASDMCIVRKLESHSIEQNISYMIENGYFELIFKKI